MAPADPRRGESAPEPGSRWGATNRPDGITPLAVRPREAARILGLGERTLWQLTADGRIPCIRLGTAKQSAKLYRVADLERWLAEAAGERGGGA